MLKHRAFPYSFVHLICYQIDFHTLFCTQTSNLHSNTHESVVAALFIVVCASINSTLSSIIIINVNMNKKKREHAPTAERVDDWVWCALATTTVAAFPMYIYICNWSSNHVCVFIHLFTTFAWCTFASSFINAKFHFNCPVPFFCFVFFFFGTQSIWFSSSVSLCDRFENC